MNPRHGEIWLVDMGKAAKSRPMVVLQVNTLTAPRPLLICIPITRQNRGSEVEVSLGHLNFLDRDAVANTQGIHSLPTRRFERRLGSLPPADLAAIKVALATACGL